MGRQQTVRPVGNLTPLALVTTPAEARHSALPAWVPLADVHAQPDQAPGTLGVGALTSPAGSLPVLAAADQVASLTASAEVPGELADAAVVIDPLLADAALAAETLAGVMPENLPAREAEALRALAAAASSAGAHLRRLRANQPPSRQRPVAKSKTIVAQPQLRSAPGWREKPRPVAARAASPNRVASPVRVACLMPRAA